MITVAIPFFSGLGYLKQAIESVRAQSVGTFQLLVVDDSGVGAAEAAVAEYSRIDERVRYIKNDHNLGMAANWNRCLDASTSELVTLLHADDRLRPGYVETMLALANSKPGAAVYFCNARVIGEDGSRRFSVVDVVKRVVQPGRGRAMDLQGETALQSLMRGNFIMCPTMALRVSVLGGRRFDENWRQVQDLEFTSRLLMDGERLVGTPDAEYEYRRHASTATHLQSESMLRFEEEFELYRRVAHQSASIGWSRAARTASRARIVKLHIAYRAALDVARIRPRQAWAKLRFLWRQGMSAP